MSAEQFGSFFESFAKLAYPEGMKVDLTDPKQREIMTGMKNVLGNMFGKLQKYGRDTNESTNEYTNESTDAIKTTSDGTGSGSSEEDQGSSEKEVQDEFKEKFGRMGDEIGDHFGGDVGCFVKELCSTLSNLDPRKLSIEKMNEDLQDSIREAGVSPDELSFSITRGHGPTAPGPD